MAAIVQPYTKSSATQVLGTPTHLAVAENTPSGLMEKEIGTVIEAEALLSSAAGSVEVQTSLGNLMLMTGLDLDKGDKVQLKIQRLLPQPQFLIHTDTKRDFQGKGLNPGPTVTLNTDNDADLLVSTPSKSHMLSISSQTIRQSTVRKETLQSVPAVEPKKLDVGAVIKATIFKFQSMQPPWTNQQSLHKYQTTSPNSSEARFGNPTANQSSILPGNTTQTGTTTAPHGAMPTLSVGSQLKVRIWSVMINLSSGMGNAAPKSNPLGQIFPGRVVSINSGGQPMVETPIGQLILETTSHIQLGSGLSLEVISILGAAPTEVSVEDRVNSIIAARNWPTLTEAFSAIQSLDVASDQQSMDFPIPKVGTQMTSNLLFFISALRGGNIRSWLGNEASALLQHTFPDLATRLSEEFNQLARPFNDAPTAEWRTTLVPLLNGSQLEFFQMNFRGGSKDAEKESHEDTSRFLIDVKLSNLGQIQLDGLIKSKGKRFDLFIRSEKLFSKIMRRDLNNIFLEFADLTGISGNLVFQTGARFVDIPLNNLALNHSMGIVV